MISIICTNCQANLTIDDAFAGGVCRCQHCGTIQTVPSPNKPGARSKDPTAAGAAAKAVKAQPKSLYRQKRSIPGDPTGGSSGTGLDELAGIVASSGLSSNRLNKEPADKPTPRRKDAPPKSNKNVLLLPAVAGLVIVGLVAVIVWLALENRASTQTSTGSGQPTPASPAAAPPGPAAAPQTPNTPPAAQGPSFCGISINEPSVIYVLDRGSATSAPFGSLKEATLKSIESLGSERKFQVIFWKNVSDLAYPSDGTTYASKVNVEACRRAIDDAYAFGSTDVAPAIKRAMSQKPDLILLVTGNDYLDDVFIQAVLNARKGADTRIETFGIRTGPTPGSWTPLKTIADRTGGHFHEITESDLRQ